MTDQNIVVDVSELSNTLSDDLLWTLIEKCDVRALKTILVKANIPTSAPKASLQLRLFYAVRLGELVLVVYTGVTLT